MPASIITYAINKKIRLFFIPYLLFLIGLCAIYTTLNWLWIVKFHIFQIHEHLVELAGPALLSGTVVMFYFMPKFKYLKIRFKRVSWESLYFCFLTFAIAVPLGATQVYFRKATGQLTQVSDVSKIPWRKSPKYLVLSKHYVQKKNRGVSWSSTIRGSRNRHLNMHISIVMPIVSSKDDSSSSNVLAWLAKSYDKTIPNYHTKAEKAQSFKDFVTETELSFRNENFDRFVYLEKVGYNTRLDGYRKALRNSSVYSFQNTLVLESVNEPFENRLNGTRQFLIDSSVIFPILWLILILIPGLNLKEEELATPSPNPAELA